MNHQNENDRWAQENGYEYDPETAGVIVEGARDLDVFRKATRLRHHVVGTYRNRPFEVLDVQKEVRRRGPYHRLIEKTVVVIPADGIDLPNFELLPRRQAGGMDFLGIKGLDLKLAASAPRDDVELVTAFNENYLLFAGGAHEAMEAAVTSAHLLVPSPAEMLSICKPRVLRFLSGATTGTIELQNGYLAVRAPEPRVGPSGPHDTILAGRARETLLTVANDLLDALQNASREGPFPGLTLENTLNPSHLFGGLVGAAVGFFVGFFLGFPLLFLVGKKFFLLIPVLALVGAVLGNFIGKRLMRSK